MLRKVLMKVLPTVAAALPSPKAAVDNTEPLSGDWIGRVAYAAQYTHDMPELLSLSEILVFIHDYRIDINNLRAVAPAFTRSTYQVYDTATRTIILSRSNKKALSPCWGKADLGASAQVRGTLVLMSIDRLVELDRHYLNGVECERTLIDITLPHKLERNSDAIYASGTQGYAYVGVKKHWEPLLDGGYSTKQLSAKPSGLRVVPHHVAEY